jgi:pimeloyl-ACP methyl ester carboxylesterase
MLGYLLCLIVFVAIFIGLLYYLIIQRRLLLDTKYRNTASNTLRVQGMQVHYRNEGDGETLLLLHGTGSSLHAWDELTKKLTPHFRVIRLDLPGFGLTGPHPMGKYEITDDVAFLSEFLARLNVHNAHVIGSSLGGRIAWQYALTFPEKTLSITLINSLGYPQLNWPPAIKISMNDTLDSIMKLYIPRFVFKFSLADIYGRDFTITDNIVNRYYDLSLREGNLKAFVDRVKARLDKDSDDIRGIRVPTLVIWGEDDKFFPVSAAHKFAKDIAGAELLIIPKVGHLPIEEAPDIVAERVQSFVKTLHH